MFDMGSGRRIEDRTTDKRIESTDNGLRIVKFYVEGERGRIKE